MVKVLTASSMTLIHFGKGRCKAIVLVIRDRVFTFVELNGTGEAFR